MFTFLVIVVSLLFVLLVVITSMRPVPDIISRFELDRRASRANKEARSALRRERLLPDVLVLQRIIVSILLVAVVLLSIVTFGWVIGTIVGFAVALQYAVISRFGPLMKVSHGLYEHLEPSLLRFVEKSSGVFVFFRGVSGHDTEDHHRFDSREELQQLVNNSGDILSSNERSLIVNGLAFSVKEVRSVMTPKSVVSTIKKSEFLGPLVLDELHQLGHSRLPVISNDIDHVVGILHLNDLLSLDIKRSVTAEKAMDPKVYYIHQDDTLEHALAAFLKTHHHLFIVINDLRETVGILTIEDVLEALIGHKIVDEDDNHEDLRAVAAKKAESNNQPGDHVDL
ncbi:MAG: CBS domain-containing protein [Candidatus Microsaccharimonas sp.]